MASYVPRAGSVAMRGTGALDPRRLRARVAAVTSLRPLRRRNDCQFDLCLRSADAHLAATRAGWRPPFDGAAHALWTMHAAPANGAAVPPWKGCRRRHTSGGKRGMNSDACLLSLVLGNDSGRTAAVNK
ncbi:hypothetical protein ZWY2020_026260 [Hordeum vulgare]|nr:hypothetical protein ZWY2020_026260 [Hordeum vulgare]